VLVRQKDVEKSENNNSNGENNDAYQMNEAGSESPRMRDPYEEDNQSFSSES